ncbi:hypothetical protein M9Y10_045132 [Tritrichomonas musculus]|uniref:Protein kinase domain-containing protein n=1 Tax=Tritrichomonas musculus TaxID=1915356 RepID=A0ABR2JUK3_9EUKA
MSGALSALFPNFTDFAEIGQGGTSTVLTAVHEHLGIKIAIKTINKFDLSCNETNQRNFDYELSILRRLDFPFISHFYGLVESDESYSIVMEYVNNGTLLDFLNKKGKLEESEALLIFAQLASCIDYLHNVLHIVHRDIKIENILLDKFYNARLIDFGMSQIFEEKDPNFHTLCGSFPYVAPEIFKKQPYSKPVDIWSLGVVLYSMTVGRMPFASKSVAHLVKKIVNQEPKFPSDLSEDLLDLLKRMLTKDPEYRITIEEVLDHNWITQSTKCAKYVDRNLLCSQRFSVIPTIKNGLDPSVTNELKKLSLDPLNSTKEGTEEFLLYRALRKERIITELINLQDSTSLFTPLNPSHIHGYCGIVQKPIISTKHYISNIVSPIPVSTSLNNKNSNFILATNPNGLNQSMNPGYLSNIPISTDLENSDHSSKENTTEIDHFAQSSPDVFNFFGNSPPPLNLAATAKSTTNATLTVKKNLNCAAMPRPIKETISLNRRRMISITGKATLVCPYRKSTEPLNYNFVNNKC